VVKSITLSDDSPHVILNEDIPFYQCDFQCQTNAVKLGIGGIQDFTLNPNETYWIYNANIKDFMIKNASAGNNGTVCIIMSVPNAYVENALRGLRAKWG